MKPLPQKYTMGSDWLAGPVCCDLLNHQCESKRHAPQLSGMCSGYIVNNGVVNIAHQFEPEWDAEDISEEDLAEPVQAQLLQDVPELYVFLFVCCCLIHLDRLLFVNAATYVSF